MNQNMGRLIRYILIIQKLSGKRKYIPADELISYLNLQMELRGYEVGLSIRTLQRDIAEIGSMFEIEIKNRRGDGYFIVERNENADLHYEELLLNFDLLTSLNNSAEASGFIIPEHHRPKGVVSIPVLIHAIKNSEVIKFDYKLVRKKNMIISKTVNPYFLKESLGLWYLVAIDDMGKLRNFAVDRISKAIQKLLIQSLGKMKISIRTTCLRIVMEYGMMTIFRLRKSNCLIPHLTDTLSKPHRFILLKKLSLIMMKSFVSN